MGRQSIRSERVVPILFLSAVTLYVIFNNYREVFQSQGGNPYLTGDWLINYEGGFNGRGLNGQIILFLSKITSVDLLTLVFVEQTFIYSFYMVTILRIIPRVNSALYIAFVFNPAFLIFGFLDTGGSFRKEIIGFLIVASLTRHQILGKLTLRSQVISLLCFVLFIFSWEAAFLFAPVILYQFRRLHQDKVIQEITFRLYRVVVIALSSLSLVINILNRENVTPTQSARICNSLINEGLNGAICRGTIKSISEQELNVTSTLHLLLIEYRFWYYLPFVILSLIPPYLLAKRTGAPVQVYLAPLSILPIFLVGLDWGRWINVLVTLVSLLIISNGFSSTDIEKRKKKSRSMEILAILFITSWRLPIAGGEFSSFFFGFLVRIFSWIF